MREIALMREFLRAGGDEILLCGMPFGEEGADLSAILSYAETVKEALGEAPLVISVPYSALQSGNSHRLLSRVGEVCDRLALDLGEADGSLTPESWLTECDFYLTQYDMRLLLCETQRELTAAAQTRADVQTYSRLPEGQLLRPTE